MASIDDLLDFINSEDPVYKIQDEDLNVKKIKDEHEKNDEDLKLCIICMVNIKNTILIYQITQNLNYLIQINFYSHISLYF